MRKNRPHPDTAAARSTHINTTPPKARQRTVLAVLLLLTAAGILLYKNTLSYGLVLDDRAYVMDNPYLRSATSFLHPGGFQEFANSARAWGGDPDITLNFITRPLTYLTFYFNRLAGGDAREGYRMVNIGIHVLNAFLLFLLAMRAAASGGAAPPRGWTPLAIGAACALLFTVHPVMTESVTYIAQRFESLATFFILGAVLLHLKAGTEERPWPRRAARGLSVLAVAAAMLSKETGVTAPVLLVLADVLIAGATARRALCRAWPHLMLLPLVPGLVLATSWAQNNASLDFNHALNITNVGEVRYPIIQYAMSQACAAISYVRLLLLPVGQNFDRDYPLVKSPGEIRFLAAMLLLTGTVVWAWMLRRRWGAAGGGAALLGVLWFIITLLPSSSVVPLPDLFAEHRSYLPSAGLFLLLAAVAGRLARTRPVLFSWAAGPVAAYCCLTLAAATLARNEVLKSSESIYKDAVAKSPRKPRAWNGLGTALSRKGRMQEALACFKKAVEMAPEACVWRENLSTAYLMLQRNEEALAACEVSIKTGETTPRILHNYGYALCAKGRTRQAVQSFELALKMAPDFHDAHLCLGIIYADLGKPKLALSHLKKARRVSPLPPVAHELAQKLEARFTETGEAQLISNASPAPLVGP